jgi:hypothetical protein
MFVVLSKINKKLKTASKICTFWIILLVGYTSRIEGWMIIIKLKRIKELKVKLKE